MRPGPQIAYKKSVLADCTDNDKKLLFFICVICGSDRSISRVRLPPNVWRLVTIYLGLRLPAASSNQPETKAGHFICLLFGLAPGGVCHACNVTITAVVSYTTVSPLPATNYSGLSILCGTFLPERGKK